MLLRKHLPQALEHLRHCLVRQAAQVLHQALTINSSQLIQYDVPGSLVESAANSPRVGATTGRQGSDGDRPQVCVQLVWRNDDARARLLYFATHGRIKPYEVNVAAVHSPLPIRPVEAGRRGGIEESVFATPVHRLGLRRPTGSRSRDSRDDEATRFRPQLDLFGQTRFVQQHLGYANAPRVSDPDNTGSYRHVITL